MIITLLKTTKNVEKSSMAPIRDSAKLMRAMNDLDGPIYEMAMLRGKMMKVPRWRIMPTEKGRTKKIVQYFLFTRPYRIAKVKNKPTRWSG